MTSSRLPDGTSVPNRYAPVTRRNLLTGIGLASVGAAGAAFALSRQKENPEDHHGLSPEHPRNAEEALTRLRAGNECYVQEHFDIGNSGRTANRRTEVAAAQRPYAVILACADSRVAPEIIFNAGLGDLFVVRVAGNIVDPRCLGVLGSIEYAIEELKIPLIFVLGHEECGAVKAAIRVVQQGIRLPSAMSVLTDAIRPVIESVGSEAGNLLRTAVGANVRRQIENLLRATDIVAPAVDSKQVQIVGGVYELNSGRVRMLSKES